LPKNITGAILGGLLGFSGQLCADFFLWNPNPNESTSLYQSLSDGQFDHWLTEWLRQPKQVQKAKNLIYFGIFLGWLTTRGEVASRTALIVAFLSVSGILAAEQLQKKRKSEQELTPTS